MVDTASATSVGLYQIVIGIDMQHNIAGYNVLN